MSDNKDSIIAQLHTLGLQKDEATLYLELLKEPSTHLRLAHATGINRTRVYRLAGALEKRSLINKRTDERGTFLVAADPATLEITVLAQEEKAKHQREVLAQIAPALAGIKSNDASGFVVHTYDGVDGFKQMLWHELKAEGENLIFGSGTIEDLVPSHAWGEKHRALTSAAGYTIRELLNPDDKDKPFTSNETFMGQYHFRTLPREVMNLNHQIVIYNNTVGIYNWRDGQKVGLEIINSTYAQTMRQVFEQYWLLAA